MMWTESVTEQSNMQFQRVSRGAEKNTATSVKILLFHLKFKPDTLQNAKSKEPFSSLHSHRA